jgi:putative acetyltransferase
MPHIAIRAASSPADIAAARLLFEAYARAIGVDLGYQGFATELSSLPGRYAPPGGVLLLAYLATNEACGCVAVRDLLQDGTGELKRLFVAPPARGQGLGRRLVAAAIGQARLLGYRRLILDSLPFMHAAIALYRAMNFAPVAPYYDAQIAGTVFLGLDL